MGAEKGGGKGGRISWPQCFWHAHTDNLTSVFIITAYHQSQGSEGVGEEEKKEKSGAQIVAMNYPPDSQSLGIVLPEACDFWQTIKNKERGEGGEGGKSLQSQLKRTVLHGGKSESELTGRISCAYSGMKFALWGSAEEGRGGGKGKKGCLGKLNHIMDVPSSYGSWEKHFFSERKKGGGRRKERKRGKRGGRDRLKPQQKKQKTPMYFSFILMTLLS